MVYRLNAGTVIDQDGNLQIENLYATGVNPNASGTNIGFNTTFGYICLRNNRPCFGKWTYMMYACWTCPYTAYFCIVLARKKKEKNRC